MAEYYALQAAFCFSLAHIFLLRGLVHSNALTGSLISLGASAVGFWILALLLAPLAALKSSSIGYFAAAGLFAPAIGQTLGYIGMERIGVARAAAFVNTSPIFFSSFAVLFLGEVWLAENILGTCLVIGGSQTFLWPVLRSRFRGAGKILYIHCSGPSPSASPPCSANAAFSRFPTRSSRRRCRSAQRFCFFS